MMLPESGRTRRPADDLPLETCLPSPPTPLGRRTPSSPAAAASHEGRERRRPSRAEGGGSAGGGGEGRGGEEAAAAALAARPEPRASSFMPPRGEPPPPPAQLAAEEVSTQGERGWTGLVLGARVPRPLTPRFPCAFASIRLSGRCPLGTPRAGSLNRRQVLRFRSLPN